MNSPSHEWARDFYRATVSENPYLRDVQISPQQYLFLTWPCREIMFGGAAGGGKTVALLIASLQFVQTPGYNAILFRRTFSDLELPDSLIPLSHQFLGGTDALWNGNEYRWHFPTGATLSFGYLASETDKYRYKSAQFAFVGFDELTSFHESQYLYMFSRQRKREGSAIPLRTRSATNPGDIGHQWVHDRFIDMRTRRCHDCEFIPSRKQDNPWLDQASYDESLSRLDYITRKQLAEGDWEIRPQGNAFKSQWFRYYERDGDLYRLGPERIVKVCDCTRFASADIAGTEAQDHNDPDYSVIQTWDVTPSGDMLLVDQWRGREEIPEVQERLIDVAWSQKSQFVAIEKNGIGLPVVQSAKRRGLAVVPIVSKRDKFARAQGAMVRMEAGTVYFPRGAIFTEELESELLIFPTKGAHDDQVDCFSQSAEVVTRRLAGPVRNQRDAEHSRDLERLDEYDRIRMEQEQRERKIAELEDERLWHAAT